MLTWPCSFSINSKKGKKKKKSNIVLDHSIGCLRRFVTEVQCFRAVSLRDNLEASGTWPQVSSHGWQCGEKGRWPKVETSDALKDHGLEKKKKLESSFSPSEGMGWGSWRWDIAEVNLCRTLSRQEDLTSFLKCEQSLCFKGSYNTKLTLVACLLLLGWNSEVKNTWMQSLKQPKTMASPQFAFTGPHSVLVWVSSTFFPEGSEPCHCLSHITMVSYCIPLHGLG